MKLLLDTHIALWAIADSPQLPVRARAEISDWRNELYVSVASVWEIAIKHAKHPTVMPISGQQALGYFAAAGYSLLAIAPAHAAAVGALPPLHADPFDRMLVAQSALEFMHLLTHDPVLAQYGPNVLVV